jgi:Tfp pilus assembly protein PilZ
VTDQPTDERRRAERVPINEEFSKDDSTGSTWVSDLSTGGVFVHTSELLPIGMGVDLRFTVLLDDPLVIEAAGKVVRHSRHPLGIGVQFSELTPEMREQIELVLSRQRPVDSGTPLRLPDPGHAGPSHPPEPVGLAQPAPVGDLRPPVSEDEVTSTYPRIPVREPPSTIFRPPPLPGKR